MSQRVIVVCGGRDYVPTRGDTWWLLGIFSAGAVELVRHGALWRTDVWAGETAKRCAIAEDPCPVDAAKGPRARSERNSDMMTPDVFAVVAMPSENAAKGKGFTLEMVRLGLELRRQVILHPRFTTTDDLEKLHREIAAKGQLS